MKTCPFKKTDDSQINEDGNNILCNENCIFYNGEFRTCKLLEFVSKEPGVSVDLSSIGEDIKLLTGKFDALSEDFSEFPKKTIEAIEENSDEMKKISIPLSEILQQENNIFGNILNEIKNSSSSLNSLKDQLEIKLQNYMELNEKKSDEQLIQANQYKEKIDNLLSSIETINSSLLNIKIKIEKTDLKEFFTEKDIRDKIQIENLLTKLSELSIRNQTEINEKFTENLSSLTDHIDSLLTILKNIEDKVQNTNLLQFLKEKDQRDQINFSSSLNSLQESLLKTQNSLSDKYIEHINSIAFSLDNIKPKLSNIEENSRNVEILNFLKETEVNNKELHNNLLTSLQEIQSDNQIYFSEKLSNYVTSIINNIQTINEKISSIQQNVDLTEIFANLKERNDIDDQKYNNLIQNLKNFSEEISESLINISTPVNSLPAIISGIRDKIENMNLSELFIEKETRDKELLENFLSNFKLITSDNQKLLTSNISEYINTILLKFEQLQPQLLNIEKNIKIPELLDFLKQKDIRDIENSEKNTQKMIEKNTLDTNIISNSITSLKTTFENIPSLLKVIEEKISTHDIENTFIAENSKNQVLLKESFEKLNKILIQNQNILFGKLTENTQNLSHSLMNIHPRLANIEEIMMNLNLIDFLKDKESRDREFSSNLFANLNESNEKNQQLLITTYQDSLNSLKLSLDAIPEKLKEIEKNLKATDLLETFENFNNLNRDYLTEFLKEVSSLNESNQQKFSENISEHFNILTTKIEGLPTVLNQINENIKNNDTDLNSLISAIQDNSAQNKEMFNEKFNNLVQNLYPPIKMTAAGILEIKDDIDKKISQFLIEKYKKDREFSKEALKRWTSAYSHEQSKLFDNLNNLNKNVNNISLKLEDVAKTFKQSTASLNAEELLKTLSTLETKNSELLNTSFSEWMKVYIENQTINTEALTKISETQNNILQSNNFLGKQIQEQASSIQDSNIKTLNFLSDVTTSVKKAFEGIEKVSENQLNLDNKLSSLVDKIEKLVSVQFENIEKETERMKYLENDRILSEAKIHNDRGVGFYYANQLQSAYREFQKALSLAPDMYETYLNLGIVLSEMGEEIKATDFFNKVIEMNPESVEAYINLGLLAFYDRNFENAETVLNRAIKVSPNYARSYVVLGEILLEKGDVKSAEISFNKALELNPMDKDSELKLKQIRGEDIAE